ncbi:hypothetical protein [Billgrantia gudaonensis]|uniref:Uncharacterized protein n=1 Tax=Billgrantia gudaonensis TaxID=376427 RepID=A0A1G8YDS5_9GAMM|nr:hypothetical protein [Halomonas gudaonensis]SDK00803.1 hypothetical protein SAMN04487954_11073 [Halomonas gudaonensis]
MLKSLVPLLLTLFILNGCATSANRIEPVRQALLGLGNSAAQRIGEIDALQPLEQQVLLLAAPEVDSELGVGVERMRESLTRALLGIAPGPQVLDWQPGMEGSTEPHQWRLKSRLEAAAPRLRLSDRELLPYRLTLMLQRPDDDATLWETSIEGAFDATAL